MRENINESFNKILGIIKKKKEVLEESKKDGFDVLNESIASILAKHGKTVALKYRAMKKKLGDDPNYRIEVDENGRVRKVKKTAAQKAADKKRSLRMKNKKKPKQTSSAKRKAAITKRKLGENIKELNMITLPENMVNEISDLNTLVQENVIKDLKEFDNVSLNLFKENFDNGASIKDLIELIKEGIIESDFIVTSDDEFKLQFFSENELNELENHKKELKSGVLSEKIEEIYNR